MKTQIFAGIALVVAGVYTVERQAHKMPQPIVNEVRVITTEEMLENSSLNDLAKKIEVRQESISTLIKETVKESVIDSVIVPTEDTTKLSLEKPIKE